MRTNRSVIFHSSFFTFHLAALALLVIACGSSSRVARFTGAAAAGPTGALVVSGECGVPDGVLVLMRAQGAPQLGAQIEQATLTPVRGGHYAADLGLYETLSYHIVVMISPAWNAPNALPKAPPSFRDPALIVSRTRDGWQMRREFDARLGAPEQEKQLLADHLRLATDALRALELSAKNLHALDDKSDRGDLARWLRLHLERQRGSVLVHEGIDPIFPLLHGQLREIDTALLKRYHAILARLTGATTELDKMSKSWQTVDRALEKARQTVADIEAKIR